MYYQCSRLCKLDILISVRIFDTTNNGNLTALCHDYIAMALEQPDQGTGFYEDSFGMIDDRTAADPIIVSIYDTAAN